MSWRPPSAGVGTALSGEAAPAIISPMDHVANLLTAQQKELLLSDTTLCSKFGLQIDQWDEDVLRTQISHKLDLPWVDAEPTLVDHAAYAENPEACREHEFLVTHRGSISMHVFMVEPFHAPAIRRLRNLFHREIHPIGTSRRALERTMAWLESRVPPASKSIHRKAEVNEELLTWNYRPEEGIKFMSRLLEEAYLRNSSDVFLESYPDRLDVRFKIGGRCVVMPPIHIQHAVRVMQDAKAFASMSTRETRGYRDGSAELRMADGNILNFRAVAQRAIFGETMTFRLLDKQVVTGLSATLPFPPKFQGPMRQLLGLKQGIIIVCGPTGSGKTTTLWRCLLSLDSSEKKIVTIEDPVEYRFDRFVQLPVKGRVEGSGEDFPETFEAALRSCLRAAPDVILVGEMRDKETAQVAIEAALTGHLILSTVHTPDAIGAFPRLFDKEVSALNIRQTVLAVVSQRLAPRLCPECRIPEDITDAHKAHYAYYDIPVPKKVFRSGGCPRCKTTGFIGRTTVFEILIVTPELRAMIRDDLDEVAMRKLWLSQHGQSLGMHALHLAADGEIAYSEARSLDAYAITA